jgi:general stress protein CsbA
MSANAMKMYVHVTFYIVIDGVSMLPANFDLLRRQYSAAAPSNVV